MQQRHAGEEFFYVRVLCELKKTLIVKPDERDDLLLIQSDDSAMFNTIITDIQNTFSSKGLQLTPLTFPIVS